MRLSRSEMSSKKNPGWLGYIGDYTTHLYIGIISNPYKDPYDTRCFYLSFDLNRPFGSCSA